MANQQIIPREVYRTMFEHLSTPVAFIGDDGTLLLCNSEYDALPANMQDAVLAVDQSTLSDESQHTVLDSSVCFIKTELGFVVIVRTQESTVPHLDKVLKHLIKEAKTAEDVFAGTAQAISEYIGWKWVAVTQFLGDGEVEVLAFWEGGQPAENFTYNFIASPCELMAKSERFTQYSDVDDAFPHHKLIQDMGAKAYAGLVYHGPDNKPLGHIMTLHDKRDVDYKYTEEVLELACITLSAHMLVNQATHELKAAKLDAATDVLTGVGNRRAFDQEFNRLYEHWTATSGAALLVIIDLNDLKTVNDTWGHEEGDKLIKLCATEFSRLGRANDKCYRLGGDEFALLFGETTPALTDVLKRRFLQATERVSVVMSRPVSASIGFAQLDSSIESQNDWFKLADERMYADKNRYKRASIRSVA
ncbi:MAG: hypothetical protein COB37_10005 [Kordiimonadales bacterium]|nr:MAG: hypothetical protein COB37_10005 [Kordiimonadales bacterium]